MHFLNRRSGCIPAASMWNAPFASLLMALFQEAVEPLRGRGPVGRSRSLGWEGLRGQLPAPDICFPIP